MSTTKIMLEKVKSINPKRLNLLAKRIAEENNKSVSYVKRDMVKNFLKHKIGYTDYFKGNYINLTEEQKKNYVTSKNYINVLAYLNPKPYRVITLNKLVFNNLFKDYLKREYLDVRRSSEEDIKKFLKGKDSVFAKPITDFGGHGISKIDVKDIKDIQKFKQELLNKKQYLLEEGLKQNKVLNEINPDCVSSFRIITLYKDGEVFTFDHVIRIGLDSDPALACFDGDMRINENGTPASGMWDDNGTLHEKHPLTGYEIKNLKKIPYVKEAIEMVKEAATLVPELRYIGWDVAITETGPAIIEGNECPSYGPTQNYMLNPDNKGHLKEIRDIIGEEEFKKIKIKK